MYSALVTFFWHFFIYYFAGNLQKKKWKRPTRGPDYQEVMWCIRRRQDLYKTLNFFLQKKAGPLDSQSTEEITKCKSSMKQMKLKGTLTVILLHPQEVTMILS